MTSSDSTTAIISAHSRRQAMDWSLALISQEIESTILHTEEGWGLGVASVDYDRAVAVIKQYRRENRGWGWRRELQWPGVTFHAGGAIWCLLLVVLHWATAFRIPGLKTTARMDRVAVLNGEWWRLFTATMLHADIAHLIANVTIGFVVFGLAMGRYGAGCALLAAYLAGVGGNLARLLLGAELPSLGASGMVMGGLGLLTVQTLSLRRENPHAVKYIISGVFAGFMLFVLLGLDPASDVIAHVGGFVSGLAIGGLLTLLPARMWSNDKFNFTSTILLAGLVILTWALALN